MKLDPAIVQLLGLDPASTTVSSHGGGGMSSASTAKITTKADDGTEKVFFMKTGKGRAAEVMFEGEHASLNAIHAIVPTLCPQSFGWGKFSSTPSASFLVTDFLHLSPSAPSGSSPSLAKKLAKLHTTPAPVPEGYSKPMFGFPVTTCCGDTPQENGWKESWAEFYAQNRLHFILRRAESAQGRDAGLRRLVEDTVDKVVPRLLADEHLNNGKGVQPVVVHGDLWSGNASKGRIGAEKDVHEVVYDPSACYAHSEYELGIMRMFGGFGGSFLEEYHRHCPKTEPVEEYDDRVELYQVYHYMNHHALFGGAYSSGAAGIMKRLLEKYGKSKT